MRMLHIKYIYVHTSSTYSRQIFEIYARFGGYICVMYGSAICIYILRVV